MQRFFNSLVKAKVNVFEGGMDKGLSYMFNSLSVILEDLAPVAKMLGAAFKYMFTTVGAAVKLVVAPIAMIATAFKAVFGEWSGAVASTGVLALVAWRFNLIARAIKLVNASLWTMIARLSLALSALIAIEDIWVGLTGGDSYTGKLADYGRKTYDGSDTSNMGFFGKLLAGATGQAAWMYDNLTKGYPNGAQQKVVIEFKGEGAEKLIETKIETFQQAERSFQMQRTTE
jgi:hypothetical protein